MVIRFKDGTQEFVEENDEYKFINLVEEHLGIDVSDYFKFTIEDLKSELDDIEELECDIEELECNLNEIYVLASKLIKRLSKHDNQELLMCLEEIKDLANV